jgi:ribosomal protein S18 acetylase RimI-like enzyme
MTLYVRDYRVSDQDALIRLWQACDLVRPWNDPAADIARAINSRESTLLVGHEAGALIASVMTGFDGHRGWAYYLAVAPEKRSRGHGREIMEEAGLWLAAGGAPKMELMVRHGNAAAQAFYEQLGFERQSVSVYGKWLIDPAAQAAPSER